jgi:hypothetical protein
VYLICCFRSYSECQTSQFLQILRPRSTFRLTNSVEACRVHSQGKHHEVITLYNTCKKSVELGMPGLDLALFWLELRNKRPSSDAKARQYPQIGDILPARRMPGCKRRKKHTILKLPLFIRMKASKHIPLSPDNKTKHGCAGQSLLVGAARIQALSTRYGRFVHLLDIRGAPHRNASYQKYRSALAVR